MVANVARGSEKLLSLRFIESEQFSLHRGDLLQLLESVIDPLLSVPALHLQQFEGVIGRHGLDTPNAAGNAPFAPNLEITDLVSGPDMGSSAEFPAERTELDDVHPVSVLVTEEHQRPHFFRLVERDVTVMKKLDILPDLLIDKRLDILQLFLRHFCKVRKIETKVIGGDQRTGLMDMGAKDRSQRGMEQVGCSMIPHDRGTAWPVHLCLHEFTEDRRDRFPKDMDVESSNLLGVVHLHHFSPNLQHTPVANLSSRFPIEGGCIQHNQVAVPLNKCRLRFKPIVPHEGGCSIGEILGKRLQNILARQED